MSRVQSKDIKVGADVVVDGLRCTIEELNPGDDMYGHLVVSGDHKFVADEIDMRYPAEFSC
jgi:hypothetical protein